MQIDYMDCALGIFGYNLDASDNATADENCQWQTYYVNRPILDWNPVQEGSERTLVGGTALFTSQ